MKKMLYGVIMATLVGAVHHAIAGSPPVFKDNFEAEKPEWLPYGSGCALSVKMDEALGKKVLLAKFDRSSNAEWCNKGAYIKLRVTWDDFDYLYFHFSLSQTASQVGCLIHDEDGNWWRAVLWAPFKLNQWKPCVFKKSSFTFAWNDKSSITSGTKSSMIKEIFIYAGTTAGASSELCEFSLADVTLSKDPPDLE